MVPGKLSSRAQRPRFYWIAGVPPAMSAKHEQACDQFQTMRRAAGAGETPAIRQPAAMPTAIYFHAFSVNSRLPSTSPSP